MVCARRRDELFSSGTKTLNSYVLKKRDRDFRGFYRKAEKFFWKNARQTPSSTGYSSLSLAVSFLKSARTTKQPATNVHFNMTSHKNRSALRTYVGFHTVPAGGIAELHACNARVFLCNILKVIYKLQLAHGQKFRTFQNGNIVWLTRRVDIYRWNSR